MVGYHGGPQYGPSQVITEEKQYCGGHHGGPQYGPSQVITEEKQYCGGHHGGPQIGPSQVITRVAGAARSRPFWLELEPEPEFVRARAGAENFKNGWLGNPGNNRREKLDQCFGSNPDPKH